MSFISIKDPTRRREIVADYIRLKNNVRGDDTNARLGQLESENMVLAKARPIVKSLDKVVDKLSDFKVKVDPPENWYDDYDKKKNNKDYAFGMYKVDENKYWLGNQEVSIDTDNNVIIDGHNYGNSKGLWNYLMLNNPKHFQKTEKDKEAYLSIAEKTDLLNHPSDILTGGTAKLTWLKQHMEVVVKPPEEEEVLVEGDPVEKGEGLQGVDGYIAGLIKQLHLVVAERKAGNVEATTPVIRQILDDLKRIGYLNDRDIVNTCRELYM